MKPKIIEAAVFSDTRGKVSYANDFKLKNCCRFYMLEHDDINVVRAWQGHRKESKYFFPVKGSFVIAWVMIDNFELPSLQLSAEYTLLNALSPTVLHIPCGYANGLRALEENSILAVFSDMTVEQSAADTLRYPAENWFNWNQDFK